MLTLNDDNRLQSIFQERFYGRRAFLKCVTKNFNYELSNYLLARYEAKAITREWSFKVVTVLSVLIVAFLHVITQSSIKEPEWIAISLPSAIPFANAYLVNILQIIIAIFWAGNFLREDRYVDANSSVSARPFSNMELLLGKTLGFILVIPPTVSGILRWLP